MAIFMQVIAARLGVVTGKDFAQCCRDWYPPLDPLAELALLRTGHRRLRPGRSAGQCRGIEPSVPYSAIVGSPDHRLGRAAAAGLQRMGMRMIEAIVLLLVATIGVCYFIEIFVLPQVRPTLWRWAARCFAAADFRNPEMIVHCHRDHWGHGHAAQPLFALGPGADTQAGEG